MEYTANVIWMVYRGILTSASIDKGQSLSGCIFLTSMGVVADVK